MRTLNRWFERSKDKADFWVIYISEAHPTDGWQVRQNERDRVLVAQHKALADRKQAAMQLRDGLGLKLPIFVDLMDDAAAKAYQAWPDRIYVIGSDGRIAYVGAPGPRGFRPEEAMAALDGLK